MIWGPEPGLTSPHPHFRRPHSAVRACRRYVSRETVSLLGGTCCNRASTSRFPATHDEPPRSTRLGNPARAPTEHSAIVDDTRDQPSSARPGHLNVVRVSFCGAHSLSGCRGNLTLGPCALSRDPVSRETARLAIALRPRRIVQTYIGEPELRRCALSTCPLRA